MSGEFVNREGADALQSSELRATTVCTSVFQIARIESHGMNGATLTLNVTIGIWVFEAVAALMMALPATSPLETKSEVDNDVEMFGPTPPPTTRLAMVECGPLCDWYMGAITRGDTEESALMSMTNMTGCFKVRDAIVKRMAPHKPGEFVTSTAFSKVPIFIVGAPGPAPDEAELSRADHVIAPKEGLKTSSAHVAIARTIIICADWKYDARWCTTDERFSWKEHVSVAILIVELRSEPQSDRADDATRAIEVMAVRARMASHNAATSRVNMTFVEGIMGQSVLVDKE
jgi:hypothetical protein